MYFSLIPHRATFTKKVQQQKSQRQSARLCKILPLKNNHALLFYDNFWFYYVSLLTMDVIYQSLLEGNVYDAVVLNDEKVLLMLNEKKNIVELDLTTKKVTEIYKIASDSLYNSKRQIAQFFLSKLFVFAQTQTFYLQQNLTDQRKLRVIYFPKIKEKTLNKKGFQVRQFEAKNYVYLKLDETASMVRFKQNPQENGKFSFEEINLQKNETVQHKIDWPSFVLYSTVIDVKKFHQVKYLIFLNSKDSSHQVVVYNKLEKSVQMLYQSQKIIKQCICVNEKLNLCMFSCLYGQTMDSQIITVVDLNSGKMIYKVDEKVDKMVVSSDQEYMIEYSSESKGKSESCFKVLTLANKTVHYLKMLQNLKVYSLYGQEFADIVGEMLQQ